MSKPNKQNIGKAIKPEKIHFYLQEKNQKLLLGLLVLFTFLIFSNTLRNLFVDWDDIDYIKDNPFIHNLTFKGISTIFSSVYYYNYHPLTTLSWALEYKLFGLNPLFYHLDNILLHMINVILVFYFIKKLSNKFIVSIIVAAFFAVHPMHVESVSWVSERKDLLYALFYLLSCMSYLNYIQQGFKRKHLGFALMFFILSLLSKSMAITLPAILLLIDYYQKRQFNQKIFFEKIPFALLSVFFIWLTLYSQVYQYGDLVKDKSEVVFSLFEKLLLGIYGIVFYIFKLILPVNLSSLHPYPTKIKESLPLIYYFAPFILAVLLFIFFKMKKYRNEIIFGFLFFLFSVSIVLQFIPVGHAVVAERYTYIPYLGLFFIIGSIYENMQEVILKNKGKRSSAYTAFIVIALITYSVITINRNHVWKNTRSLFTDVIEKYPNNYYCLFALGNLETSENNLDKAMNYYEKSIAINKKNETLFNNYGMVKHKMNDFNGAVLEFTEAIKLNNNYFESYINRGNSYMATNQYSNAIKDFTFVINHQKKGTDKFQAYYNRAIAYYNLNNFTISILNYDSAISIEPQNFKFYNNRALAKMKMEDVNGAIEDYTKAIDMNNSDVTLLFNRAVSYTKQNDLNAAIQDYSKCIQLKSDYFEAYFNRANIYCDLAKYNEAIQDYTKAIEISPSYIMFYKKRANAYFQNGNLSNACIDWKKSRDMGNIQANELIGKYCK